MVGGNCLTMHLLSLSLAPVFVILLYVFYRDKYEHEPFSMLLKAFLVGAFTPLPIILVERYLSKLCPFSGGMGEAFWTAFVVAAFSEEFFKLLVFFAVIWKNRNFNEKFDGIVYAVFISLGFAAVENVMYVFQSGEHTAYIRAFTAVPAHALFAVSMGFFLGMAKFHPHQRWWYLSRAIIEPILLHGVYDFILMSGHYILMMLFVPYLVYLWFIGLRRMKWLSDRSVYRPV